jgi:hypothetical protein
MNFTKLLKNYQASLIIIMRILAAETSRTWVYGRLLSGIAGLNPAGGLKFCVLSGRGLCGALITRPEEPNRLLSI